MTFADTEALEAATGYAPSTPLADGIGRFVNWYRQYENTSAARVAEA